jgi:MFS family permease
VATLAADTVLRQRIPAAAWFALVLMATANLFNYLDRQIVSILAQSIKADLKLDDADLGFILGTAFAVFYSVVGIAMGRISDFIPRRKLMAFGVALWSVMTALGGAASSFATLAIARIGVGVGEAVANPCSNSLLADMFPKKNRAAVLGANLSGTFLGGATAMVLGGIFIQYWSSMCTALPWIGACEIRGWQAALFAVGLTGLPLALLILLIREPARPQPVDQTVAQVVSREVGAALPPFTFIAVHRLGGSAALVRNLMLTAVLLAAALLLYLVTGDKAQWAAFAFGAYAVVTWGQVQSLRDRPLFRLTYGDRTFVMAAGATALIACIGGAIGVWSAPYAMRTFDKTPTEIGLSLGLIAAAGGFVGVLLGGWMTDRWRARDLRAPMGMLTVALTGIVPGIVVLLAAEDFTVFLAAKFVIGVFGGMWGGATAALMQDLVLPRMRGAASAAYSLVAIVVASGIGPYWAGKVSVLTGSLNAGLLSILLLAIPAYILIWLTARRLPSETYEARLALARTAGEPD